MPKPKAGRTLKNFVEEWKHNVAPTLKPSTVPVGIELKAMLKARKLLIPLSPKNDKNIEFAQARYTRGTRPPKRKRQPALEITLACTPTEQSSTIPLLIA